MSLKIVLKPNEKFVINGAVMSSGVRGSELILENQARFLRGKDVLLAENAQTPSTRIYYTVQCLYLSDKLDDLIYNQCMDLISEMMNASTLLDVKQALSSIRFYVQQKEYYPALKVCKLLIDFETELFNTEY